MIRLAQLEDTPRIHQLILELAAYEKAPDEAIATIAQLESSLFGANPVVFCHVAIENELVVGIAIWFLNYSTWLGKPGIYLEDLYVDSNCRGKGYGFALLQTLARICVENNYERLQWWVLDWNQPSIDFYKSIGAVAMDEWTVFRVSGEKLNKLGN